MKSFTINDLKKEIDRQIRLGNGKKRILISSDDEGNEYHELFFLFTPAEQVFDGSFNQPQTPYGVDENNIDEYIILG